MAGGFPAGQLVAFQGQQGQAHGRTQPGQGVVQPLPSSSSLSTMARALSWICSKKLSFTVRASPTTGMVAS
jgi:hypothetical protein